MNQETSQIDRYLCMLDSDFFGIDKRDLNDFVGFVTEYSKFINFYNAENNIDGNWSTFFENDITILLIQISSFKIEKIEDKYYKLKNNNSKNLEQQFLFIYEIFELIENWKIKLEQEEEFSDEIQKLIKFKLNKIFYKIIEFEEIAEQEALLTKCSKVFKFSISSDWQTAALLEDNFSFESESIEEKITEANIFLDNNFILIVNALKLIVESSRLYIEKKLSVSNDNKPYVALLIAFWSIYEEAQKELNKFTSRHLEYYYYDILKFSNRKENPDTVYVDFILQNGLENKLLPKGTLLYAGADSLGNEINYATNSELIITKAQIADIKAIVNHEKSNYQQNNTKRKVIFLTKELNKNLSTEVPEEKGCFLGFALATSFLNLEEGQRNIKFTFNFQRFSFDSFKNEVINNIFNNIDVDVYTFEEFTKQLFYFTYGTVENDLQQWFNVPLDNITTYFQKSEEGNILNKLIVEVSVDDIFPAIANCISDEYPEAQSRNLPVVKFFINQDKLRFYNYFKKLVIDKIQVDVEVIGVKNLKLQNDYGILDRETPFEPFGPIPSIGSKFYIGHENIFSRELTDLHINFEWHDVPLLDYGFAEYYDGYSFIDSNDVFKAKLSLLNNKKWYPAENQQIINLFEDVDMEGNPETPVNNFRIIDNIDLDKINIQFKGKPPIFNNDYYYSSSTRNGYIKLEFCFPPNGFGNKEYPEIIKKSIAGNIKKKNIPESPNEPWIPTLKSVSINYSSSLMIDFDNQELKNRAFLYEIHPFGETLVSEKIGKQLNLLPYYNFGSELYVGIENITQLQTLSILFNINEFASDYINEKNDLKWSLLHGNEWLEIKDDIILSDSTNELMNSGIIVFDFSTSKSFNFSEDELLNNTLLEKNLVWLRCQSIFDEKFIYNIINIKCQAVSATYVQNIENSGHLLNPLPKNTIQSFVEEQQDIAEIHQEIESFGGNSTETEKQFKTRVSERLRHKNRAITKWDYERIILQNFPDVDKIVCLNYKNQNLEFEPGSITIIVIPVVKTITDNLIYEPKFTVSKLNKIKNLLKNKVSPFVKLNVCNPVYEKVQVKFEVKFREGLNEKFYLQNINEDIKKFLNPWLYDDNIKLSFGNKIYGSHILYFLETREYVDHVSNFAVYHFNDENIVNMDNAFDNDVVLYTRTEVSIFISADNHIISVIGEKNEAETLESMVLEADFVLNKGKISEKSEKGLNKEQIEVDFIIYNSDNKDEKVENISIEIDNFYIT